MLKLYIKCDKCKRKMQPIFQIQQSKNDSLGGIYECPVCKNRIDLKVLRCVI